MTSRDRCAIQPPHPRFSKNFEMNSSELVTIVAEAHDISKAQAQAILDSVLKSIVKAAASNDEVSLAGFGKFKVKASPEREGNPANGEKIKIAASKKLSFSPAKAVKDVLNA
jgi:DNA-binding protein HU-beta